MSRMTASVYNIDFAFSMGAVGGAPLDQPGATGQLLLHGLFDGDVILDLFHANEVFCQLAGPVLLIL